MRMPSSWRSWFWNAAMFFFMSVFTILCVMQVVWYMRNGYPAASAGMAAATVWPVWGALRAFFAGVWVNDRGIKVRGYWLTTTIPWEEVVEIQRHHPNVSGMAGLVGATSPAVVRRRKGKPDKRIELRIIGTYGLTRRGQTLGDRAIDGLTWHWERWKARRKQS